ncbi:MAG: TrmB family transcriptional regulator [DPANN group archaeon]|nr:TrmB family transcriptional regulator [DPANN group archaeon]
MPQPEPSLGRFLKKLNLGDYETRALTSITIAHDQTAKRVSSSARIPLTKVYAVLDALASKNLIIVNNERPQRYRPIRPREMVDRIIEEKSRQVEQLAKELNTEVAALNDMYYHGQKHREKPVIWANSSSDIWNHLKRSFIEATSEMRMMANRSWEDTLRDPELAGLVEATAGRGVKVRFIMPDDITPLNYSGALPLWKKLAEHENVAMRCIPKESIHHSMVIQDDVSVGRSIKNPHTGKAQGGIIITEPNIIKADIEYFDQALWKSAQQVMHEKPAKVKTLQQEIVAVSQNRNALRN